MTENRRNYNRMGVTIIAEVGVNHNGSIETAKELVRRCKAAEADVVKFQAFNAEALASPSAPKAAYQEVTEPNGSQLDMLKRLELSEEAHAELKRFADSTGIEYLVSPFDPDSIELVRRLGMRAVKVPSGKIVNPPYLRQIASLGVDVILSTGMATLGEVEQALGILEKAGAARESITLLHCVTEYPAPYEDVNLRAMNTLRSAFGTEVGFSDHTEGIEVSVAAVALGATVIEKHVTLDRSMTGPDHAASIEPDELARLVASIRHVEQALGSSAKQPVDSEKGNREIVRESIVASRRIETGEVFGEDNLTTMRPGGGLSPLLWDQLVGRVASRAYDKDEQVTW